MPAPLRILFVTAECAPLAKTGGLGDVSAALPAALAAAGHDVRVFLPLYARIDRRRHPIEAVPALRGLRLAAGAHSYLVSIHRTELPGSRLPVHLVDNQHLYGRPGIYTQDADEHLRFAILQQAALKACQQTGFAPDIIHANDWQAALLPLYLRTVVRWDRRIFGATRSVLTIHNAGYQGSFAAATVADLGLEADRHLLHQDDLNHGLLSFLKTGILYADAITTVSPTYARELRTAEYSFGLDRLLVERGPALVGILNGIDPAVWSPDTDRYLPARYDASTFERKAANRQSLLARAALQPSPTGPVLGIVSRLSAQKGLDLALGALPAWLARADLRLVVLGSGDPGLEAGFRQLEQAFAGRVRFVNQFSEEVAHLIEGGADAFLMPSRFEPCGLNQMYSLRYGTVPIVRNTGGLADTVEPWDGRGEGTGFVFDHPTVEGVSWAIGRAVETFARPADWRRLALNGMARDFSWATQARRYIDLYRALAA